MFKSARTNAEGIDGFHIRSRHARSDAKEENACRASLLAGTRVVHLLPLHARVLGINRRLDRLRMREERAFRRERNVDHRCMNSGRSRPRT